MRPPIKIVKDFYIRTGFTKFSTGDDVHEKISLAFVLEYFFLNLKKTLKIRDF